MTGRTSGRRPRRRATRPRTRTPGPLHVVIIVAALVAAAACQATFPPETATAPPTATATATATTTLGAQADIDAIRATVDAVNVTAGGPVADQQAQLLAHVDPARRDEVRRCPAATTTIRLEPVDQGLRALPEPSADAAAAAGTPSDGTTTSYALPTLIRIFSGDRLIGTDLTTLKLVVRDTNTGDEAYLTPFCVN